MLDDSTIKDRPPFDVTTIEEEVSAFVGSRTRSLPNAPLRRLAAGRDRPTIEPPPPNLAELALPATPASTPEPGPAGGDLVNHPPHYTTHPSGIECIQITRWMTFNLGNAVKYIWRCDQKGATIQDLKKARWYLDDEIARLEGLTK